MLENIKQCSSCTSFIRRSLTSTTLKSLCPSPFSSGRMHYWTESINKNLHSFVRKALKKFLLPQLLPVLPWPLAPPALHQGGNGAPRKLVHCTFFNTSAPIEMFNLQPEFLLHQGVIDSALTKNGQDHPDLDPDPPPALRRRLHRVHHLHCSLLRHSHYA